VMWVLLLGAAGEQSGLGWSWIVRIHALIQSLNGAWRGTVERQKALLCSDVPA
jgi:hypothetical protein